VSSRRILAVSICLGLAIGHVAAAVAQQSPQGTLSGTPLAQGNAQSELTELFAAFCLMKFPDANAADLYARLKGFKPMPEERLRATLGKDPGTGWLYDAGFGTYAITIEHPPHATCTIGNRSPRVGDIKAAFGTLLTLWAGAQHTGSITGLPPRKAEISGRRTETYLWELASPKGKETFMALVTPGSSGAETEVRLVRSIGKE